MKRHRIKRAARWCLDVFILWGEWMAVGMGRLSYTQVEQDVKVFHDEHHHADD